MLGSGFRFAWQVRPTPGIVAAIQSIVAQQCLGSQAWVVASIPRLKGQYRSLTDWSIVPQGSGRTQGQSSCIDHPPDSIDSYNVPQPHEPETRKPRNV